MRHTYDGIRGLTKVKHINNKKNGLILLHFRYLIFWALLIQEGALWINFYCYCINYYTMGNISDTSNSDSDDEDEESESDEGK